MFEDLDLRILFTAIKVLIAAGVPVDDSFLYALVIFLLIYIAKIKK